MAASATKSSWLDSGLALVGSQSLMVPLLCSGQPFEAELQGLGHGGVAVARGVAFAAGDAAFGELIKDC
jgi:hypothetical protein